MRLDHVAIGCTDLDAGAAWIAQRLGVAPEPGGRHPMMGTWNRLLSLGPAEYLELIAIDPAAPAPARPRWFGLDDFDGPPRVVGWVARADAAATPAPEGSRWQAAARGDLRWQITLADSGKTAADGTAPALIDWGDSAPPPTRLRDHGLRLTRLTVNHPLPPIWTSRDPRIRSRIGPPAMTLTLSTPNGPVTL